jgi:hypothetical protein
VDGFWVKNVSAAWFTLFDVFTTTACPDGDNVVPMLALSDDAIAPEFNELFALCIEEGLEPTPAF